MTDVMDDRFGFNLCVYATEHENCGVAAQLFIRFMLWNV